MAKDVNVALALALYYARGRYASDDQIQISDKTLLDQLLRHTKLTQIRTDYDKSAIIKMSREI